MAIHFVSFGCTLGSIVIVCGGENLLLPRLPFGELAEDIALVTFCILFDPNRWLVVKNFTQGHTRMTTTTFFSCFVHRALGLCSGQIFVSLQHMDPWDWGEEIAK